MDNFTEEELIEISNYLEEIIRLNIEIRNMFIEMSNKIDSFLKEEHVT